MGATFAFAWVAFFIFDSGVNGPRAVRLQAELESQLATIPPPSGAILQRHSASAKAGSALVEAIYSTTQPYVVIRSHYDNELVRSGWSPASFQPGAGIFGCYEKAPNFHASLEDTSRVGPNTFGIALVWGSRCDGSPDRSGDAPTAIIILPTAALGASAFWLVASVRGPRRASSANGQVRIALAAIALSSLGVVAVVVIVA